MGFFCCDFAPGVSLLSDLLSGLLGILHRYWSCAWFSLAPRTFAMDSMGLGQTYQVKSTELRLEVSIVLHD